MRGPRSYDSICRQHKRLRHNNNSEALRQTLDLEVGKLAVRFFFQAAENEGQGIVEEPASSQIKEETTDSLRASALTASATLEIFVPTNWKKKR
jgi:hypothetical protein